MSHTYLTVTIAVVDRSLSVVAVDRLFSKRAPNFHFGDFADFVAFTRQVAFKSYKLVLWPTMLTTHSADRLYCELSVRYQSAPRSIVRKLLGKLRPHCS